MTRLASSTTLPSPAPRRRRALRGGLALVGERGPELINFASPGHIHTADQTRDMMRGGDNAELIAELRELRARLDKIGATRRYRRKPTT